MPENEIIRRRSALLLDVTQAASEVSKTRRRQDPRGPHGATAAVARRRSRRLPRRPPARPRRPRVHRAARRPAPRVDVRPRLLQAGRPGSRPPCGSTTYATRPLPCSSARAPASRRCRSSLATRPPASPWTPTGTCSPTSLTSSPSGWRTCAPGRLWRGGPPKRRPDVVSLRKGAGR
jgi:hypothetical protein